MISLQGFSNKMRLKSLIEFGRRWESTNQATDFVQQLFIDKIKEYAQKSKSNDGKMFDPIPELEKEREELYAVLFKSTFEKCGDEAPPDTTAFPTFDFKDVQLDPIDSHECTEETKN